MTASGSVQNIVKRAAVEATARLSRENYEAIYELNSRRFQCEYQFFNLNFKVNVLNCDRFWSSLPFFSKVYACSLVSDKSAGAAHGRRLANL